VAEAHRLSGAKTFSLDEVSRQPEEIINGKTRTTGVQVMFPTTTNM
jgi:hypothetical protein